MRRKKRRVPNFFEFWENCCSCNNWRLPGEPQISKSTFLPAKDYLIIKLISWILLEACIPKMATHAFKSLMTVHFGNGNTKIFKVWITLLRLSMWVLFYLYLWVVSSLDTTIVTYGKQNYSVVPHSHANYTFVPFEIFVLWMIRIYVWMKWKNIYKIIITYILHR